MKKKVNFKENELFKLRSQIGMSRNYFAKFIGRSDTMLWYYEKGKIDIPKKVLIRAKKFVEEVLEVFNRYDRKGN